LIIAPINIISINPDDIYSMIRLIFTDLYYWGCIFNR